MVKRLIEKYLKEQPGDIPEYFLKMLAACEEFGKSQYAAREWKNYPENKPEEGKEYLIKVWSRERKIFTKTFGIYSEGDFVDDHDIPLDFYDDYDIISFARIYG